MSRISTSSATTILIASLILLKPLYVEGSTYPVCTNNKITLPGVNGPEIWSCVGYSGNYSSESGPSSGNSAVNNSQTSADLRPPVEQRTTASSDAMNSEIERVLENTTIDNKRIRRKNVSAGIQYSSNRKNSNLRESRSRTTVIPLGLGLSLTDRIRLSVSVPLVNKGSELVANSDVYNSDVFGMGDIGVNATSQIYNETDKRPAIALSFGIGAPTGKVENPEQSNKLSLGSGFWTTSLGATASKRFDPATVFGSVRYQHVFSDNQFGHEVKPGSSIEYSYGIGLSLNSALSVSGHFAGAIHRNSSVDGQVIRGSNSEPLEFVTSSSLRLSKSTRLESNLAIGLNKDASDARIGLTVTKDF